MSVDVFGRTLSREKNSRGPPGIGFNLTSSGDFDIGNKLLSNVALAVSENDAVNLKLLEDIVHQESELINSDIVEIKEEIKAIKEEIETIKKNIVRIQLVNISKQFNESNQRNSSQ